MRGFDRSHVLIRSRKVRTFQNQTSSDIVTKIVQEAGFRPDCDSSGDPHEFMQQDNETDWDFIWRLAERVGFEFVIEDQTAHFRKPARRRRDRARVADDAALVQPAGDRDPAGAGGDAAAPRTRRPSRRSTSPPRPRTRSRRSGSTATPSRTRSTAPTMHIATEPVKSQAEGQAARPGAARQARQRLHRRRGRDRRQPADQGRRRRSACHGRRQEVQWHLPRRGVPRTCCAAAAPTRRTSPTRPPTRCSARSAADRGGGAPSFGTQLVLGLVTNNDDPESIGPRPRAATRRSATMPRGRGRGSRRRAPATRAGC